MAERELAEAIAGSPRVRQQKAFVERLAGSRRVQAQGRVKPPIHPPLTQAPPIQRWSVKMIDDERDRLQDMDRNFGGELALHHIISRDQITSMVKTIGRIASPGTVKEKRQWAEAASAAQEFLTSVANAAKKSFGKEYKRFHEQTRGAPDMILHNLPVNLVAGPRNPLGDPGTSFDPATVKGPAQDRDERVMDARSRCLERLLLAFEDLGNARTEGSDADAAAALKVMAKALIDAVDTLPDPSQVPNVDRDEWFAHDARFAKKQKGTYREALAGIPIFQNARVAPPAIPANPVNIPAAAMGDKTLALHISANQIIHIYQRHSYAHFDFNVLKLRNTFWPAPMTVADIYIDIVAKARRLYQSLRAEHVETEPDELEDRQVDLQLPGVFTIGKIESDVNGAYDGNGKPQDFIVQIETIAPEGVDQYTKAQLTAIHLVVP